MKIKLSTMIIVLVILAIVLYYVRNQDKKDGFVVIPKDSQKTPVPFEYTYEGLTVEPRDSEESVTLIA